MKRFLGAAVVVVWALGGWAAAGGAEQPAADAKVAYLDRSVVFEMKVEKLWEKGLLARELVRQSLLIAARDELGLLTRDYWLGEAMPGQGDNRTLDLAVRKGEPNRIDVFRGAGQGRKPLAELELKLTERDYYPTMIADAERLSRTGFVETLKKIGYQGKANAWKADAALPDRAARLLEEMTPVAQFLAVREIHAKIRSDGESPERLAGLVRGYANLGLLTEFHWHPAHKVFKARALLYADRLLQRGVRPAWSRYQRAYAYAMVGLHQWAMHDLEAAEKLPGGAGGQRPSWAAIVDAYCRYRLDRLDAEKIREGDKQLFGLLEYMAAELSGSRTQAVRTGLAVLEKMPECYRVHDGVCRFGGVSTGHSATIRGLLLAGPGLYARLAEVPGLPDDVGQLIRQRAGGLLGRLFGGNREEQGDEFEARARLIEALLGAGRDEAELSWSALGLLLREMTFVEVWRRAHFEHYSLSVSSKEFLAVAAPLVASHPYRAFIESLTGDFAARAEARERLSRLEPESLEFTARELWNELFETHPQRRSQWARQAWEHRDDVARDTELAMAVHFTRRVPFARKLIEASPMCPLARSVLVKDAWKKYEARAAGWEKDDQPAVLAALGERYLELGRWADAERCLKAAIKRVPEQKTYETLADLYDRQGDEARWLSTLEEFLKQPDYALSHGQVCQRIATHFIGAGQWEKALPYAKGAAETYSNWGLVCAGSCYEGLQQWPEAEKYFRASAERYDSASLSWYFFCRRTGHGDLAGATALGRRWIDAPHEKSPGRESLREISRFRLLERDLPGAMAGFQECFAATKNMAMAIYVALAADELKDVKTRDEALKQIQAPASGSKGPVDFAPRKDLIRLAEWMAKDLAAGGKARIDLADVDKRFGPETAEDRLSVRYCLGKYLDLHGRNDDAIKLWKEVATCRVIERGLAMANPLRTMAAAALLQYRVTPEDYATALRKPIPDAKPKGKP